MKVPPPDLARRLVEAGEEILAGDPPPRLEDVAVTVGTSRASLYYYFSGRDDLLTFLLTSHAREGADRALARAKASDPPQTRLRAMLEALVEYLGAHPGGEDRPAERLEVADGRPWSLRLNPVG